VIGEPRAISQDEAGRPCPYCRFALKPGAAAIACPTCHAPHHGDCWDDNGGCALVGCASGPNHVGAGKPPAGKGALPTPVQPAAAAPPPPVPGAATAVAPAPRGRRWLLLGVVLLAVAAIGAATGAFALRGGDGDGENAGGGSSQPPAAADGIASTPTVQDPTPTVKTVPAGDEPDPQSGRGGASNGGSTDADRRRQITRILLAHHRALVRGDFRRAWALTSARYRAKKLREAGGYPEWASNQRTVQRYISPESLRVTIRSFDARSGVATIRVAGMGWSAPSSPCRTFEGITWAKLDGGNWRYEPGYSISDKRRAMWEPRGAELLGAGCV